MWQPKSPRLSGFDYSQQGAYFVTVCIQDRQGLLGEILNGEMRLNQAGRMVEKWWKKLESNFPAIKTDFYVIMPNHFHGIIVIAEDTLPRLPTLQQGAHMSAPLQKILQWFKTMTTNEYVHGVKEHGWPQFNASLWQRSFYDHVIRTDEALNRIREYIRYNPQRWDLDRENPQPKGEDEFDRWLATFKTKPIKANRRGGPMCPPADARRQLGDQGEDLAAAALKKQGYKILERNYVTPLGEIDLIARQGKTLVVVEVKTRRGSRFGAPQEAVNPGKQGRLRRLADYYLKAKRLTGTPVRFDVVAVTLADNVPQVEIIPNAF
jgi:putative transposase